MKKKVWWMYFANCQIVISKKKKCYHWWVYSQPVISTICNTRWVRNKVILQAKEQDIATVHHCHLEEKKLPSRLIINQAAVLRFDLRERERDRGLQTGHCSVHHRRPLLTDGTLNSCFFPPNPYLLLRCCKKILKQSNLTRKIVKTIKIIRFCFKVQFNVNSI